MRYLDSGISRAGLAAIAGLTAATLATTYAGAEPGAQSLAGRCAALPPGGAEGIVKAVPVAEGPIGEGNASFLPPELLLPAHCDVSGVLGRRKGIDGQDYAIHYHLRLPEQWNGRFFFQGGSGLNGHAGDAVGMIAPGVAPALVQGYAVVTQDSGHDSWRNNVPDDGGEAAFGADPRARAEYGGVSLKLVADAAKGVIRRFYGSMPRFSYFVGCSKGGQEGMAAAQRYPDAFDGVVAAAPGFSLPRAALAQTWDVQTFAPLVSRESAGRASFRGLPGTFSAADLGLVRHAVLEACDADDGLADGIVGGFAQCTSDKVLPAIGRVTCKSGKQDGCLSAGQVSALQRTIGGPRDSHGKALYASWPWDGGIGSDEWRVWKVGNETTPALSVVLGGPALASVFTVPRTRLGPDPQRIMNWQLGFDFDRDAPRIYATNARFTRSGWQDVSARSPDLGAFRARGGKLIVPHGVSDPVFSINDTLAWYQEVEALQGEQGHAADFVRVFPVPGMAHCTGGPATDNFDAFTALTDWVEKGHAPDRIVAKAGWSAPWPGRTRPLCPYPQAAVYSGKGDIEKAENFVCR